jgi:hypothetical protein
LYAAVNPSARTSEKAPLGDLWFDKESGWITWSTGIKEEGLRLCWLPVELRGRSFNEHKSMFVVASASTHQLTIIDFASMLNMLRRFNFIL